MAEIKFKEIAHVTSRKEGGAEEVNIAQINQVLAIAFDEIATHTDEEILAFFQIRRDTPED